MVNIPNYQERGLALLASQFQIKNPNGSLTNLQKLLSAFLEQAQEINTQEQALQYDRALDTAVGVQLDGIGEIVGLARDADESDANYRERLQFQIFVNSSEGTPEQVIRVLQFLTKAENIWYNEIYPAAYQMATDGLSFPEPAGDLVQAIQSVSPAGVHFVAVTATYNTNPFVFSSDPIDEQLYVAPDPDDPSLLEPFQANPGSGLEDFYIQRGETVDPNFGGGFAEAMGSYPTYTIDETGAGQLAEALMTNGNIPPAP